MPRHAGAVLWTLAILFTLRLWFGVYDELVATVNTTGTRPVVWAAVKYLRENRAKDSKVVFLGSSRLMTAIAPEVWAKLEGLRPEQIVNLAVHSGSFWDALFMMRRGGGLPDSVNLAIIEIGPSMFNQNTVNPVTKKRHFPPAHFIRWADLADRWKVDSARIRIRLVAEWVWPIYLRQPIDLWVKGVSNPRVINPALPTRHPFHWDRERAERQSKDPVFMASNIARDHFHDFAISHFDLRILEELVGTLRERSIRVALVQPPVREEYMEVLLADEGNLARHDELKRRMRVLAVTGDDYIECEVPEDCGLDDDIFVDYGHFNLQGAETFTEILFERISNRGVKPAVHTP